MRGGDRQAGIGDFHRRVSFDYMGAPLEKELNPTDQYVGSHIRMRRMMLGMSQTTLGDAAGVTFQQVQKYEKGINRVSASRIQQFAKILGVPLPYFFDGAPIAEVGWRQGERP